ncbi:hypothetical protein NL676_037329 [Syzygium grande]|nr:hypothetical protein NL676_037329 [Syzygium grande]
MAAVASSKQMTHHPNFSKTMELRWAKRPTNTRKPHKLQFPPSTGLSSVPIYISTRPGHVDLGALRDLYASRDLSCHQLPDVGFDRVPTHHEHIPFELLFRAPNDSKPVDGRRIEKQ